MVQDLLLGRPPLAWRRQITQRLHQEPPKPTDKYQGGLFLNMFGSQGSERSDTH